MNRNNKDKKKLEHFANLTNTEIFYIVVGVICAIIIIGVIFMGFKERYGTRTLAALAPSMSGFTTSPTSTSPFLLTNTL